MAKSVIPIVVNLIGDLWIGLRFMAHTGNSHGLRFMVRVVEAAIGMSYGTILAPVFSIAGFDSLQICFAKSQERQYQMFPFETLYGSYPKRLRRKNCAREPPLSTIAILFTGIIRNVASKQLQMILPEFIVATVTSIHTTITSESIHEMSGVLHKICMIIIIQAFFQATALLTTHISKYLKP